MMKPSSSDLGRVSHCGLLEFKAEIVDHGPSWTYIWDLTCSVNQVVNVRNSSIRAAANMLSWLPTGRSLHFYLTRVPMLSRAGQQLGKLIRSKS